MWGSTMESNHVAKGAMNEVLGCLEIVLGCKVDKDFLRAALMPM